MKFELIPADLPHPRAYLIAGLARPTNNVPYALTNLVAQQSTLHDALDKVAATAIERGASSITVVDDDNKPLIVIDSPSQPYLTAPSTYSLFNDPVERVSRSAAGILEVELAPARSIRAMREAPEPLDFASARPVTVDLSVVMAGLDKAKFRHSDAIFVSAALDLDLALMFGTQMMPDGHVRRFKSWRSWDASLPVPIEGVVGRIFKRLTDQTDLRSAPSDALDRTDLYCAATAIAYEAPLYTTHPGDYAGLKHGLKVIPYGAILNKRVVADRDKASDGAPER